MPTIALFYGIIIQMYFLSSEHNPPLFMQSIMITNQRIH